eukprot:TRINITY_DN6519_c0_g1_i2.p1 TRINITY_DN6519_c0_g1~~TRINITY_DN6519_c0_g1_i2.p1  ORF type:complete len:363 (-),score=69.62 TRINITY_DN6519_c0_g1_i2:102-1190(-)
MIKLILLLLSIILFINVASSFSLNKPPNPMKHAFADYKRLKGRKYFVDNKRICLNKKIYNLNYNVSVAVDNIFLVLEEQGASNITCNLDPSSMLITFPSSSSMQQFSSQIKPVITFITSQTPTFFCKGKPLLRRVFAFEEYTEGTNTLLLSLSDSRYDEIFDKAHISFGSSSETCGDEVVDPKVAHTYPAFNNPKSGHFCLGINTNEQCTNASQPLQLYNNQYITVTCEDCFFALTGDVFLEVHIDLFECISFTGGFVNLEMLGSLIMQLQAHIDWSAGIDKNIPIGGEINLLNFNIGPVPVHLYFLLDLGFALNSQYQFTATATIGTSFNYTWDCWYVKWGLLSGWEHVHPSRGVSLNFRS